MLGSIYSGITGLRNFQDQLDIVANNIANVNTVGYKGSRATFQTLLFQTLRSGVAPQNQLGGINPLQIGTGSQLASIDKLMTQGSPMSTGKVTDLMIQGEGFFILSDGTDQYYTRAGNFTRDYNGFFLEPATGMKLQGWTAKFDEEGNRFIDTNEPIGDIQVSANQIMEATETSFVALANNLNAGVGIQDTTIVVKSTTGESIPIKFSFSRDMSDGNEDKNVYNWTASVVGSDYKFAVDDGSGLLTSTNEITGKVELDDTGNVISWVNYDNDGDSLAESKISIFDINGEIVDGNGETADVTTTLFDINGEIVDENGDHVTVITPFDINGEIVDENGDSVTVTTTDPNDATLTGSIGVTDGTGETVYYDPEDIDISFDDSGNLTITLNIDGTLVDFTGTASTVGDFNTLLLGDGITSGDYTLTGLQLTTEGTNTDTINAQTHENLKSKSETNATLTGSIGVTDGTGETVYYDPEDIDISFDDSGNLTITLNIDGTLVDFTGTASTVGDFNTLLLGDGITSGDYTLTGLQLTTEGTNIGTIGNQTHENLKSKSETNATLTGSIGVTDDTTGETVYYDPENIDIKFEGTEVSITLTKKDGTTLIFTRDATSFGNNDAEISIEEFNDLLSEGIVDESGTYTLTGLRLVGDSDTYTINNQTLSDLKSVREMIQPPLGGAIRLTDLNNPTNFSEAEYVNPSVTTSTVIYDSLGNPYNLYLNFSKIDTNTWYWKAEVENEPPLNEIDDDGDLNREKLAEGVIAFDANGDIAATQWKINSDGTIDDSIIDDTGPVAIGFDPNDLGAALNTQDEEVDPDSAAGAGPVNISINFQELSQFFAENSIAVTEQDGNAQGTLESFAIDNNGQIIGSFTNGLTASLGQIALATFNNPEGLSATANSMYAMSANSGTPQIGVSGVGGRGSINSGALEMSNVDLAEEFTNMIIAQRGFQANSRSITTADAILNEIINIKR